MALGFCCENPSTVNVQEKKANPSETSAYLLVWTLSSVQTHTEKRVVIHLGLVLT